jgi:malonyl-CoA/methylmalonyl-CoA synthetase
VKWLSGPRLLKNRAPSLTNLYAALAANFPRDLSACAVETENAKYYSWQDIEHATAMLANWLASLKLSPGARVVAQVDKSVEAMLLYLATIRAGFVFVPLNSVYQSDELEYFIAHATAQLVVCSPRNLSFLKPIAKAHGVAHVYSLGVARDGTVLKAAAGHKRQFKTALNKPQDLAAILYASSTNGQSKGAMLSHENLLSNALTLKDFWGWENGDVLLHALPVFQVHGLFVALHGALANGSKMIWLNQFNSATVLRFMPRASVFMGTPTMFARLLDDPNFSRAAARNMRLFVSGAAPLLHQTFTAFEQRLGKRILESYAMREALMVSSNPATGERVGGTVGLPLPQVSVRVSAVDQSLPIGQTGEIEVKGANVFLGYWNMPQETREQFTADGYFKTGTVGRFDTRGYLSIEDRGRKSNPLRVGFVQHIG